MSAARTPGSACRPRWSGRRARPATHDVPRGERVARVGRQLGLDADDPRAPGGSRATAAATPGEPAAADRHEDGLDVRQLLDDLEAARALAGDDPIVVIRRDDVQAALGGQLAPRRSGAPRWPCRPTTISAPSPATRRAFTAGARTA